MTPEKERVLRNRRETPSGKRRSRTQPKRPRTGLRIASLGIVSLSAAVGLLLGISYSTDDDAPLGIHGLNLRTDPEPLEVNPPKVAAWKPGRNEEVANGKVLASKIAQAALTYSRGTTIKQQSRSLKRKFGIDVSAEVLMPVVKRGSRSWGRVLYPQLSGYNTASMGAMVVVRQTIEDESAERNNSVRVLDVRLQLDGTGWKPEQLASTGGTPAKLSPALPRSAKVVLSNRRIVLSDSARWDIKRGLVDTGLLEAMAKAAETTTYNVAVLITGHPDYVWNTDRPSAHSAGLAADIYKVDGTHVVDQREVESPAFDLAYEFVASSAQQVGRPWVLGAGGYQSFTDTVHQDHIHLQQTPTS